MKLSATDRNAIRAALTLCDELVTSVQIDYSGRGMYGKVCFGFTSNRPLTAYGYLVKGLLEYYDNPELLLEVLENVNIDNMRRDMIVYFPNIEWDAEEPEDLEAFFLYEDVKDEE